MTPRNAAPPPPTPPPPPPPTPTPSWVLLRGRAAGRPRGARWVSMPRHPCQAAAMGLPSCVLCCILQPTGFFSTCFGCKSPSPAWEQVTVTMACAGPSFQVQFLPSGSLTAAVLQVTVATNPDGSGGSVVRTVQATPIGGPPTVLCGYPLYWQAAYALNGATHTLLPVPPAGANNPATGTVVFALEGGATLTAAVASPSAGLTTSLLFVGARAARAAWAAP